MRSSVSAATLMLAALLSVSATSAARAADRPPMPSETIDPACTWQWLEGKADNAPKLSMWAQDCKLPTGHWQLRYEKEMPGFSLWIDDQRQGMVLQTFSLPKDAKGIEGLLPQLRSRALIADSDECVFQPAAIGKVPKTVMQYEIRPVGQRLKDFEATPEDQIPDPPCGDYAWSTHGVRYFQADLRTPGTIVYFDLGQDGTLFAPGTVVVEP